MELSSQEKREKIEKIFLEHYIKLNKEQKEAVDTIEGPVMVIAGPGTGKTQILTLRIANILRKTDTAPEQILAVTFTESGVHMMRKRLSKIIGSLAYRVNIYTFHSFCNDVIERYPEYFPRIVGRVVLTSVEKLSLMEKIIDSEKLELLRPYGDPYYYIRSLLSAISDLKREALGPLHLQRAIEKEQKDFDDVPEKVHLKGAHKGKMKGEYADLEKQIAKHRELLIVYEAYERELAESKRFDYEDMILEAVSAMREHEDLRLILQETYQFVLADEHQDANAAQNAVLELLSSFHQSPNLFIVGDEKQAIFRFQGASLENFLYFKEKYKEAKVVTLTSNYRSHQSILDAAHSLLGEKEGEKNIIERPRLVASGAYAAVSRTPLELYTLSSSETEARFVAEDIEKEIKNGVSPKDITVLYRENKDAFIFSDMLSRYRIPFVVHSEGDALTDPDIEKLIILLRAVAEPHNDDALGRALFLDFLKLKILDCYKVLGERPRGTSKLAPLLLNTQCLKGLGVEEPEKFSVFLESILAWQRASKNKSLSEILETVMHESGYIADLVKQPHAHSALHKLDALLDESRKVIESKRTAKLSDFLEHLDTLTEYHMGISVRESVGSEQSVSLMTAHKAKGQEYEVVYIVGVREGKWGGKRARDTFHLPLGGGIKGDEDDERRLFYVALTRAKRRAVLTYASKTLEGKDQSPSRFLEEIDSKLIEVRDTTPLEKKFLNAPHILTLRKEILGASLFDKDYIKERLFAQGLAVTALNNYLKCTWHYFFVNLIRLPQSQTKHQLYGISVHHALKETIDRIKALEGVTEESFMASFEGKLSKLPFSELEYEESLKKGYRTLPGYFKKNHTIWGPSMLPEVEIKAVPFELPSGEELMLKGSLDRMDKINDSTVRVLDYKTKKPMSRNEIEGNTKSATGNEKRQLIFYKLLVDEHFSDRKMTEGVIDFIEPTEKGLYISESFNITEEEVKVLKKTIGETVEEILNLSFVKKGGCEKKDCEYCKLAKVIFK